MMPELVAGLSVEGDVVSTGSVPGVLGELAVEGTFCEDKDESTLEARLSVVEDSGAMLGMVGASDIVAVLVRP